MRTKVQSFLTFVLLALLAGCSTADLPAEFRPLTTLSEGNPLGPAAATTVGSTVYVEDLGDWEGRLGETRVRALLLHEREHSIRQHEQGVGLWLVHYLTSTSFAWREERLGWYVQIVTLRDGGEQVNPEGIAKILADYKHPMGKLVSYEEALAWVRDVLSGAWKP